MLLKRQAKNILTPYIGGTHLEPATEET